MKKINRLKFETHIAIIEYMKANKKDLEESKTTYAQCGVIIKAKFGVDLSSTQLAKLRKYSGVNILARAEGPYGPNQNKNAIRIDGLEKRIQHIESQLGIQPTTTTPV